eukprot:s1205_g2.t1
MPHKPVANDSTQQLDTLEALEEASWALPLLHWVDEVHWKNPADGPHWYLCEQPCVGAQASSARHANHSGRVCVSGIAAVGKQYHTSLWRNAAGVDDGAATGVVALVAFVIFSLPASPSCASRLPQGHFPVQQELPSMRLLAARSADNSSSTRATI